MAFPWACISTAELATAQIVEDLQLGIELAQAGFPPVFCPEALVTSRFPTTKEGARGQRTRWEHGHLSVILNEAPRLLWESAKSLNLNTLAMALDLSVPPLALLVLQIAGLWVACISFLACFTNQPSLPLGNYYCRRCAGRCLNTRVVATLWQTHHFIGQPRVGAGLFIGENSDLL